jgi:hypothetical protein
MYLQRAGTWPWLNGADACFSQQAHVLAVVAPPAPAAKGFGVVSSADAAFAGAQTVSCGDATLSQQEKNTRQMSKRT